jgi:hypothetical protein
LGVLLASQPTQTALGDWIEGGDGQTLLVAALEQSARNDRSQTLVEWLKATAQQLPITMAQRYPELIDDDLQLPEFLDFAIGSGLVNSHP